MLKKLVALLLVSGLISVVSAQNARLGGLGGTFVTIDVANSYGAPSLMNFNKDVFQLNAQNSGGAVSGSFIGIKSLGSTLSAGMYYNGSQKLNGSAELVLGPLIGTIPSLTPITVDAVPHILLGLDLSALKLGFDIFYERGIYRFDETDNIAGAETKTEADGKLSMPGLVASAFLDIKPLPILIIAGVNKTNITGITTVTSGTGTTENEASIDGGLGASLVFEISPQIGPGTLVAGVFGNLMGYQPSVTAGNITTDGNKYSHKGAGLYIALRDIEAAKDLKITILEQTSVTLDDQEPDNIDGTNYDPGAVSNRNVSIDFWACAEKSWSALKRLDAIQARAGMYYAMDIPINREEGDGGGNSHELRRRNQTTRTSLDPAIGFGLSKGPFQLDLNINPANVVSFADVSVTFDLKKKSSRKAKSMSQPMDESTPEEESDTDFTF